MHQARIVLSREDIDRVLSRMVYEILEKTKIYNNIALIGIHTRGVFLSRRIRSKINAVEDIDPPAGEMDITLYRDDWTRISPQAVVHATDIPFSVDGRQVILVDDVLFTGRTIRAAMDALIDFGRPSRIELAVLIDRGHRELPIQANYVGKQIETRFAETVNVRLHETDGEDCVVLEDQKGENNGGS